MDKDKKDLGYWNEQLKNLKDSEKFIWDYCDESSYKKSIYKEVLDKELGNKLSDICKNNSLLIYTFLISTLKISLSKYMSKNNIVVGIPCYSTQQNRRNMHINKLLPLVSYIDYEKTYLEYMDSIKGKVLGSYKNQAYLNSKILLQNGLPNDVMELIQISVCMKGLHEDKDINYICESSKNELSFLLDSMENKSIKIDIVYDSNKITEVTVKALYESFTTALKDILNDYNKKIKDIKILSEKDLNKILYEFNDTKSDYPKDKTIHELFEVQVEKTPDNIAVVFENKKLTYRELNERANSLARVLRGKGVKADSIVGIMVERSLEMVVGIMAILKAGGAYLPIDPNYPKERIEYMLKDSGSKIILSKSNLVETIEFDGELIDLFNEGSFINGSNNLDKINNSQNLAYIIYTSGTTGNPKGVLIEHRNIVNLLTYMEKKYPVEHNGVYLLKTNYVFDVSVTELFGWFIGCGSLAIICENDHKDANAIINAIDKYRVTHINFVPSMLNIFNEIIEKNFDKISSLKYIFSAGEELNKKLAYSLCSKIGEVKLENLYGPTETTVYSSMYSLDKTLKYRSIPIGKPAQNTNLYILNNNELVPIGVSGELYIAGDGLARGYVNREKLTAEKFVDNPFEPQKKMYKTGDLARWLPDGNIEFLGRVDNQVKIRGFRIELGEIESRLLQHENIKEVAVLVKENKDSEKYICAYVISNKKLQELDLKGYLKETLPEYMVPAYFMELGKMPLTTNGKLDRRALPEPNLDATLTEYEAPRNEVEETLSKIWSEILGGEKIGINDNFFDLGGHSLKATMLMSKIHKELNKEVPLKELFKSPTIKELAKYIESTEENLYSKIEKVEEKEYYETSSAQKRMYMLHQFDLKSIGYNMPGLMVIKGRLNVEKLEKSFNELIERHETLRTYFETIDDRIVQRIDKDVNFKLELFKLEHMRDTDKYIDNNVKVVKNQNKAVDTIVKDFVRAFDLSKAPILRVGLIELEENKHILMFDMHHIISDGVSMGILTDEFAKLYEGNELEELKIQYKDYSEWQNSFLKSEEMQKQKEYWINRFSNEIPVLNMPTNFKRPQVQSFEGDSISFEIDGKLTESLRKIARETGSTMYMVLLSGLNVLLSKYSGQEDIIVGSPISGRSHADLENIIGMFVNTLAMRNYPLGSMTYEDFLKAVKENSLEAYENQDYQFEELVDKLPISRDIGRNPLFDVMFTMQNFESYEIELKDLIFKGYEQETGIAKFDLTLFASELEESVIFNLQYSTKLYKRETIERMIEHFVNILKAVTADTKIKLSEIEMLSEVEKCKLLNKFNDTYVDYPREKTIHELFEEQVEKAPNNIAVVYDDKKLTYRELNEKANGLARTLRIKGVKPDTVVAIMLERSLEMIVGILAILKSGGAYLPIDPEYPEDRIRYMLDDSKTKILLTQEYLLNKLDFGGEQLNIQDENIYSNNVDNLGKTNDSKKLAYVIYTSGSTGKPKGVMMQIDSVVNLLLDMQKNYPLLNDDTYLLKTSFTFDVSVAELFGWFLNNGRLAILEPGAEKDPTSIARIIEKHKITHINFVPSMLSVFVDELEGCNKNSIKSLKYVFVAGEKLSNELVLKFYNSKIEGKLVNIYGPTETTYTTGYLLNKNEMTENIPIGKPLSNIKVYVIDKNNKLAPIGVSGELCVSGVSMSRGYLNNPELTAKKFVENPFSKGEKMYRTGDLVRWLPDGNIEFLGRIDFQVKIRGFRIELGEIESNILTYEGVKETIVLDMEDETKSKFLCAYIVPEKKLTVGELRLYLSKKLPEYMIPSYFVQLEKIPLTPNGKINRKALSEPDGRIAMGTEYAAPRNEIEERLVSIWKEVLNAERVGINDNFFELGGHSLKVTILINRIHDQLNIEIPFKDVFGTPTIKCISEYIRRAEKNSYSYIEKVEEREYYPISLAQNRIFILNFSDNISTAYNMPTILSIEGNLDFMQLEAAFIKLIKRHEILRTSFHLIDGKPVQKIYNDINFHIEFMEVKLSDLEQNMQQYIQPFDISKAPLLRVKLIKIDEKKYILLLDIHHIIADGESLKVIVKDLLCLYNDDILEELGIQYKDFAVWQEKELIHNKIRKQEAYWLEKFIGDIPFLNIPIDYPRMLNASFAGNQKSFEVDKDLTIKLKKLALQYDVTMNILLFSIFNILLYKWTGQKDIIIGIPVSGRTYSDVEELIGMFVNTIAIRSELREELDFIQYLGQIKDNMVQAYDNQEYPFEKLVTNLRIKRKINRNPLFDVLFVFTNKDDSALDIKGLKITQCALKRNIAKFDITLNVVEQEEKIVLDFEYMTNLFKHESIEKLGESFIDIIKLITQNSEIYLTDIKCNKLNISRYIEDFQFDF